MNIDEPKIQTLLFSIIKNKKDNIKCLIFKRNLFDQTHKNDIGPLAAIIGDINLLRYANKNGCKIDNKLVFLCAIKGCSSTDVHSALGGSMCIQYLLECNEDNKSMWNDNDIYYSTDGSTSHKREKMECIHSISGIYDNRNYRNYYLYSTSTMWGYFECFHKS